MQPLLLDQAKITIDDLVAIARSGHEVDVSAAGEGRVAKTSALIERWVEEKRVIYGITTGFGALCNVSISAKDTRRLQENILMSHAAGVGDPLPEAVVRAIMALRIHDCAWVIPVVAWRPFVICSLFLIRG